MSELTVEARAEFTKMMGECRKIHCPILLKLADRLEKVEAGLVVAFKHMESNKCLGGLPTPLYPLHDEFLDGDLK